MRPRRRRYGRNMVDQLVIEIGIFDYGRRIGQGDFDLFF